MQSFKGEQLPRYMNAIVRRSVKHLVKGEFVSMKQFQVVKHIPNMRAFWEAQLTNVWSSRNDII